MIVFFFKQRTAYERRISDWSSDVCSSDLNPRFAKAAAVLACSASWLFWLSGRHWCSYSSSAEGNGRLCVADDRAIADTELRRVADRARLPHLGGIGSASCRDRVCQYV